MKTSLFLCAGALTLLIAGIAPASAAIIETHSFQALNLQIPDGDLAGLDSTQSFISAIDHIDSITVSLAISGLNGPAFNGDIYAYLRHDSGFSVLLNRTGKSTANPFGYDDNGFSLTFDDSAINGDVHIYKNTMDPMGSTLTGIWQPDARPFDLAVTELSPRTNFLSSFAGLNASGS